MPKKYEIEWMLKQVHELLFIINAKSPPINLNRIAKLRNILKIYWYEDKNSLAEALLSPTQGGFNIKLARGMSYGRKRFSIAHEIAHTFFYDCNSKSEPRKKIMGISRRDEEDICDIAAAEILMPLSLMEKELSNFDVVDILKILDLSNKFQVSIHAMTKRLYEMGLVKQLIIFLSFRGAPNKPDEIKLRINGSVGEIDNFHPYKNKDVYELVRVAYREKLREHFKDAYSSCMQTVKNKIDIRPYKEKEEIPFYFNTVCLWKKEESLFQDHTFTSSSYLTQIVKA